MIIIVHRPTAPPSNDRYIFHNWSQFRTWRSKNPYYNEPHEIEVWKNGDPIDTFTLEPQADIDSHPYVPPPGSSM